MFNPKKGVVQCNRTVTEGRLSAISDVSDHWMPARAPLQSNLVRAARLKFDLQEGAVTTRGESLPLEPRPLAFRMVGGDNARATIWLRNVIRPGSNSP